MCASEVAERVNDPTVANIDVDRPKDGEKAADNQEIDEADGCKHGGGNQGVSDVCGNSRLTPLKRPTFEEFVRDQPISRVG